jgi:hypothetical protein
MGADDILIRDAHAAVVVRSPGHGSLILKSQANEKDGQTKP